MIGISLQQGQHLQSIGTITAVNLPRALVYPPNSSTTTSGHPSYNLVYKPQHIVLRWFPWGIPKNGWFTMDTPAMDDFLSCKHPPLGLSATLFIDTGRQHQWSTQWLSLNCPYTYIYTSNHCWLNTSFFGDPANILLIFHDHPIDIPSYQHNIHQIIICCLLPIDYHLDIQS